MIDKNEKPCYFRDVEQLLLFDYKQTEGMVEY